MNDILEFLKWSQFSLTIEPNGSWKLFNENGEHLGGEDTKILNELIDFVMKGELKVPEKGELRGFTA
jgi:hypothetical protein